MSHAISSVLPSWRPSPLTIVRIALPRKSQPGHEPGAEGAQGVGALHAQHRAGVGVAEVVQPVVVGDRVAGDVVAGVVVAHVPAGAADDDGDLALVVEPLAVRRPHDRAAGGSSAPRSGLWK